MRFAIVLSRFNPEVTDGLLQGAIAQISDAGFEFHPADLFEAPGAFEIPIIAQRLARSGMFDGVICLGCVIKGDTAHFEFISLGSTMGIMSAMLATEVPIAFGILTTYTDEQAVARSREDAHNKGREAANAAISCARTLHSIPVSATPDLTAKAIGSLAGAGVFTA